MTQREEDIRLIREEAIAANPNVGNYDGCPCLLSDCQNFRDGRNDAPISIADVLNALFLGEFDNLPTLRAEQDRVHQLVIMWNLFKPLEEQEDTTLSFIASLLRV